MEGRECFTHYTVPIDYCVKCCGPLGNCMTEDEQQMFHISNLPSYVPLVGSGVLLLIKVRASYRVYDSLPVVSLCALLLLSSLTTRAVQL